MENKNRQSTGSLFLSIPGLIILAICLAVSLYFKASIISTFLLLFLVLCFIALSWSRRISNQLKADIKPITGTVFPGEEIVIETVLSNEGRLSAIWTDLYAPVSDSELAKPMQGDYTYIEMHNPAWTGQAIHQKYTWISGYQQASSRISLLSLRRGILHIPHIYLCAGDGFGIGNCNCGNPPKEDCTIVIYPKLYPVNTNKLLLKGSAMNPGKHGIYDDVTLLKNIRRYQHGDSSKHVNWRMLAKGQNLPINLYEQLTPESIFFLLDLESYSFQTHRPGGNDNDMMDSVHQNDMELAISFVASCITALGEQGVSCGLITPGYGDVKPIYSYGGSNAQRIEKLLLMLAEISYRGGHTCWPEEQLEHLTAGIGTTYVVTKDQPNHKLLAYTFLETAVIISTESTEMREIIEITT